MFLSLYSSENISNVTILRSKTKYLDLLGCKFKSETIKGNVGNVFTFLGSEHYVLLAVDRTKNN